MAKTESSSSTKNSSSSKSKTSDDKQKDDDKKKRSSNSSSSSKTSSTSPKPSSSSKKKKSSSSSKLLSPKSTKKKTTTTTSSSSSAKKSSSSSSTKVAASSPKPESKKKSSSSSSKKKPSKSGGGLLAKTLEKGRRKASKETKDSDLCSLWSDADDTTAVIDDAGSSDQAAPEGRKPEKRSEKKRRPTKPGNHRRASITELAKGSSSSHRESSSSLLLDDDDDGSANSFEDEESNNESSSSLNSSSSALQDDSDRKKARLIAKWKRSKQAKAKQPEPIEEEEAEEKKEDRSNSSSRGLSVEKSKKKKKAAGTAEEPGAATTSDAKLQRKKRKQREKEARKRNRQRNKEIFRGSLSLEEVTERFHERAAELATAANLSNEEIDVLQAALEQNFLFAHLLQRDRELLVQTFQKGMYDKGHTVFEQDHGDDLEFYFYVVSKGKVVFKQRPKLDSGKLAEPVDVGSATPGMCFGEHSLLYNCPREKTAIVAQNNTELYRIDQTTVCYFLLYQSQRVEKDKLELLMQVPFLKQVAHEDLVKLSHVMTARIFVKDEFLIRQGEKEEEFFLLQEGKVVVKDDFLCLDDDDDEEDGGMKKKILGPGQSFGERSLVTNVAPLADTNVIGLTTGVVFCIDRLNSEMVVGKLSHVILQSQTSRQLGDTFSNYHHQSSTTTRNSVISSSMASSSEDSTIPPPTLSRQQSVEEVGKRVVDLDFAQGDSIIKEGDSVEPALYLVSKGSVEIKSAESGETIEVVDAGGVFDANLLQHSPKPLKPALDLCTGSSTHSSNNQQVPPSPAASLVSATSTASFTVTAQENTTVAVLPLGVEPPLTSTSGTLEEEKPPEPIVGTRTNSLLMEEEDIATEAAQVGEFNDDELSVYDGSTRKLSTNSALKDLQRHAILGEGKFGQVWLVSETIDDEPQPYALKIQSKFELEEEGLIEAAIAEKEMMQRLNHPFIINLVTTYQDTDFVYFLLELVQGGELWTVMYETPEELTLDEGAARFYGYCIADALAYMHKDKLAYRDLKPENIMIDRTGYPTLIDLGYAKFVGDDKTYTFCGTPAYVSPEVLLTKGHDCATDHWSLGILIHELLAGSNPFCDEEMDQSAQYQAIIEEDFDDAPNASSDARDLVRKLLNKDSATRLGSLAGGERDILNHAWFTKSLDLRALRRRQISAPWVPQIAGALDTSCFEDWSHLEDKSAESQCRISAKHQAMLKDF